jgi:hypothetical protein
MIGMVIAGAACSKQDDPKTSLDSRARQDSSPAIGIDDKGVDAGGLPVDSMPMSDGTPAVQHIDSADPKSIPDATLVERDTLKVTHETGTTHPDAMVPATDGAFTSVDTKGALLADSGPPNLSGPPFTVKVGLFNQDKPEDLGLAMAVGTETVSIFKPSATTDHFSNGVVMIGFKGYLYAQWQSSAKDEDAPDTWVAYSRSQDGKQWSPPMTLAPKWDQGYRSSGGWWTDGNTLVGYINVWPSAVSPRGGYTEYTTSTDGMTWTLRKAVTMADGSPLNGIFEQDPHALPDGRIINAAHFQRGLIIAPCYTDDPLGISGWIRGALKNLAFSGTTSREMEPSWFRRADGAVVMVFRDQATTFRRLASVSGDRGQTWTAPVVSEMVDSRSKQSAGNLPDGTAFQVGNPVEVKLRIPLALSLSQTGQVFDKAFILRRGGSDLQDQRYPGESKGRGYGYPKSMVYEGHLYISYATNKEDAEYTRIPLTSLTY